MHAARPRYLLFLLLTLSLLTACTQERPRERPERAVARVLKLEGIARIKRQKAERWEPAEEGAELHPGDQLWIEEGTAELEYGDGQTAVVPGGTVVEIEPYQPHPDDGAAQTTQP